MRVIAGSARGTRLMAPRGLAVRPSSDRLREALFSALDPRLRGAVWWDACAGTGAVGIEALSRGGARCVFSERSATAHRGVRENLERVRLVDRAELLAMSWERAATLLIRRRERLDLLYFDPPYDEAPIARFMATVTALLKDDAIVLFEHRTRAKLPTMLDVDVTRTLKCGSSSVSFLQLTRRSSAAP